MSLCDVLRSYASPEAERNASTHAHTHQPVIYCKALMMLTCHMCVFILQCAYVSAQVLLWVHAQFYCSLRGRREASLPPTDWREISVLQLCGHPFLTCCISIWLYSYASIHPQALFLLNDKFLTSRVSKWRWALGPLVGALCTLGLF